MVDTHPLNRNDFAAREHARTLATVLDRKGIPSMTSAEPDISSFFLEFSRWQLVEQYWPRLRTCVGVERADAQVTRQIPWLRVFVEGVVIEGKLEN